MAYYNDIGFFVELPVENETTGDTTCFPVMGSFTSIGGSYAQGSSLLSTTPVNQLSITPPISNVTTRSPYNYAEIKAVLYKSGSATPVHGFEIQKFIDYPYSSLSSNPIQVENNNTDALSQFLISGFTDNDFLLTNVYIEPTGIRALYSFFAPEGINSFPSLTLKGRYLLI